jgi:hypothetical protein
MGYREDLKRDADRRRREREADRERHRAEREADRERHQLEALRMKALGEQAKGKRGVWTTEYKGRLTAIRRRDEERARSARGCLIATANGALRQDEQRRREEAER